jgi:hypothetical protein
MLPEVRDGAELDEARELAVSRHCFHAICGQAGERHGKYRSPFVSALWKLTLS